MISRESAVLLVIDFQEKLLPKIPVADLIVPKAVRLIRFARELEIPILLTEQYPKGLGRTVDSIVGELEGVRPIEKTSFGCLGDAGFCGVLADTGRNQIIITGVETHVCVLQTVLGAIEQGFSPFVVQDAVGSRAEDEHMAGLARMRQAGADIVTVEMAMFEVLRDAAAPEFKRVLPLLK